MQFASFKNKLTHHLVNLPGWHTKRKIVVFESDDWGSIRMPSRSIYEKLLKEGIRVDQLSYNRYDALASEDDLKYLFEVLNSVNDINGNPAILTANTVTANPDFDKIYGCDFQEYHFESFTETLKRYPNHQKAFYIWLEGIEKGVFKPQFHGREHLNVNRWIRALRENIGKVRKAFDYHMFDLSTSLVISENSFMETLNFENKYELESQKIALSQGLNLFEDIFGYRSETFIAPCYTWSNELDEDLWHSGIKAYQGIWYQKEPLPGKEHRFKRHFHYTGQQNKLGQIYLVRNLAFEPSENPKKDWINDVMGRMEITFRMKKPAIIGTHRANFIGFIDPENRDRNLPMFRELLNRMLAKWPDIEFMSSDQLLNTITVSKSN